MSLEPRDGERAGEDASAAAPENAPPVARRALLAGGLGALAATALGRPARAQEDDVQRSEPLLLNEENEASDTTSLVLDADTPAFAVENPTGPGIVGASALPTSFAISCTGVVGMGDRWGLVGSHLPASAPVTYTPPRFDAGVAGSSPRIGVVGSAALPLDASISIPVRGLGVLAAGSGGGLAGLAVPENGFITLTALSEGPVGVLATASGEDSVALLAQNPDGTALRIEGSAAFSCAGRGTIPARMRSVEISDPGIGPDSLVNATLAGDTGAPGSSLHHVEVDDGTLRIELTAPTRRDTPFNYFVFERC